MGGWLAQRRAAAAERRRRAAVVNRSTFSSIPPEVCHALDFFLWSALDDQVFEPQEPRPFSDDERYYNDILNLWYHIDVPSRAQETLPRMQTLDEPRPDGAFYLPYYFPDDDPSAITAAGVAKHNQIMVRFEHRHHVLLDLAEMGTPVEGSPSLPSKELLLNANAFPGYYAWIREEQGLRFADSTAPMREQVTVLAPMAAVIAPGVADDERLLFHAGWVKLPFDLAREVIQDFIDPEALLPLPRE